MRAAVRVGEQVDGVAVGRVGEALVDGAAERAAAAAGVVVGEAADLGLDHRALLGVDDAADPPVEKAEHQARSRAATSTRCAAIRRMVALRNIPASGRRRRACSRVPRTVWISGGSPSASILRRRRLMWTSMTLVRGSKR